MKFASWLKSWKERVSWKRPSQSRFRPEVEQLEDRCTPSSLPPSTSAGAIQISASPAPNLGYEFSGTVGQSFTSETLNALTWTGSGYVNNNDYKYTVSAGYSLPPGLNLTGGVIKGTPTMAGQFNVPIQVADGSTSYDSTIYQFLINPQAAATITSGSNVALPPSSPITINVNSTAGFPQTGSIQIQTGAGVYTTVQYNGLSPNGTAFLNCTGGTGTLQTGDLISPQTAPAATIANGSNGVSLSSNPGTIYVSSTAGFPSSGSIEIQTGAGVTTLVQYGKLSTSGSPAFLNVTGGTGTLQTGDFVITAPQFRVSTTLQGQNPLNDLQYNNGQTLPLGIVDQRYNATVAATNPTDPITGVQITTYKTLSTSSPGTITPVVGSSTIAGIHVQSSGNTYSIYGLDGTSGPALNVSWTSGNVSVSGTPTFSAGGQSYPLFLSVTFQDGTTHNFNFSFGYSPQEIENAYNFNKVGNGAGQTIVILEGGRIPNLVSSTDPNFANSDLNQFDQIFPGLNTFGQPGGPVFLKVDQNGESMYTAPVVGANDTEEIQDIEWAHALAPMANIVDIPKNASSYAMNPTLFLQNLVNQELPAPTNALTTTITSNATLSPSTPTTIDVNSTAGFPSSGFLTIQTAAGTTVVQYTSLSATAFLGSTGQSGTLQTGEKITLSTLYVVGTSGVGTLNTGQTSSVTYVDSAGDNLKNPPSSTSGSVVATGYTQLTQSPTSSYASEAAVFGVYDPFRGTSGAGTYLGSAGNQGYNIPPPGNTPFPSSPSPNFQASIESLLPAAGRAVPDVSFNGSPESGDIEFNSLINSYTTDTKSPAGPNQDFGGAPFEDAWGTSISSPSWDALFAIANQGRAALGKPSLSSASQTLPMLYSLVGSSAFNPIATSVSSQSNTDLTLSTSPMPNSYTTSGGTVYSSYGSGIYNTRAGLGTPVVDNLIPTLIGPTLTPSSGALAAGSQTLAITGSDFVATSGGSYKVSFSNPNVTTNGVTYISPTTLSANVSGLSGLAPGTPLLATVTMTVPLGPTAGNNYTDTTGAPVEVATTPS